MQTNLLPRIATVDLAEEITPRTIDKIYTSKTKDLLDSVVALCRTIEVHELETLFDRLVAYSMYPNHPAGELINILCNADKKRFKAAREESRITLFRGGILIVHVGWSEFSSPWRGL